jgi:hypothetical protein
LAPEESAAGENELAVADDLFMKDADVDPVLVKAQSMAAQDLGHVALHRDGSSFCLDIQSRILSTHRAALIIEAPTSTAKIFGVLFKLEIFPTNGSFSMWIYIGSRLDLLPFVMGLITRRFPDRTAYVITIGPAVQGGRKKSSFAIFCPFSNITEIPSLLSWSGCRAKASEALRLRCGSNDCPHKPAGSLDLDVDENHDLHEDDLEPVEADFEVEEEDDDVAMEEVLGHGGGVISQRVSHEKTFSQYLPICPSGLVV